MKLLRLVYTTAETIKIWHFKKIADVLLCTRINLRIEMNQIYEIKCINLNKQSKSVYQLYCMCKYSHVLFKVINLALLLFNFDVEQFKSWNGNNKQNRNNWKDSDNMLQMKTRKTSSIQYNGYMEFLHQKLLYYY